MLRCLRPNFARQEAFPGPANNPRAILAICISGFAKTREYRAVLYADARATAKPNGARRPAYGRAYQRESLLAPTRNPSATDRLLSHSQAARGEYLFVYRSYHYYGVAERAVKSFIWGS